MPLRPEILRAPRPDGSLELYDPLLERSTILGPDEAARLEHPDDALQARLASALLTEGPVAEQLRVRILAARRARPALAPPMKTVPEVDWSEARDLPDGIAPRWRDGESLRRLAEDRAAGRRVLVLRGFLAPAFAQVVRRECQALPRAPLRTDRVQATRARVGEGLLLLREVLTDPGTRRLLGAVLGVDLPAGVELNAWCLEPGDHMRVHPDGPRYRATVAVGLEPEWRAADGGAIAFGTPSLDRPGDGGTSGAGFQVRERWLPHLGDLCLFVPSPTSWHQVESPRRTRWTVSGWWVEDGAGS